jgi:hypothetical protein
MAYNDKYSEQEWNDESRCLVCRGLMGKSEELICSATCEDIYSLGLRQVFDIEFDCA